MSRRLLSLFIIATLGIMPQGWGASEELTSVMRFGNPAADAARVSLRSARLSQVSGARVNAGGIAVQVEFGAGDWPELGIRPAEENADWSGMRALAIPVDNPTTEPIDLLVRVDDADAADGDRHRLTGYARVRPGEAVVLVLPLQSSEALAMGMRMGPPPEAPRLEAPVRVIGGARGAVDRSHIVQIHLIIPKRSLGRTVIFGDPGILRGADPGLEAYRTIVDGFGQYTRADWDGKVESRRVLREERLREEQELREWPPPMALDRYGGLLRGPDFAATGFFRTEWRDGRWWLVTPEGHGFFSLGIDVVSPDVGATFVEERDFMFAQLPGPGNPLAAHYGEADKRHGLPAQLGRRFDHGRTFDFYAANLQRKYGQDYLPIWRRTAVDRLRAWGFNTIGNWSEPELLARRTMPFVVPIHIYGNFREREQRLGLVGQDA